MTAATLVSYGVASTSTSDLKIRSHPNGSPSDEGLQQQLHDQDSGAWRLDGGCRIIENHTVPSSLDHGLALAASPNGPESKSMTSRAAEEPALKLNGPRSTHEVSSPQLADTTPLAIEFTFHTPTALPDNGGLSTKIYELQESYRSLALVRSQYEDVQALFHRQAESFVALAERFAAVATSTSENHSKPFPCALAIGDLQQALAALASCKKQATDTRHNREAKEAEHRERELAVSNMCGQLLQPPAPNWQATEILGHVASSARYLSDDELPELLHEYYESAGDLTIFRERLQEFEFDHIQELRARDRRRADGQPVDPPEREFLEQYFAERQHMIEEISETRERAQRLREECLRDGLKPEPVYDVDDFAQVMDRLQRAHGTSGQHVQSLQEVSSLLMSNPFEQIKKWAEDVRQKTFKHLPRAVSDLPYQARTESSWSTIGPGLVKAQDAYLQSTPTGHSDVFFTEDVGANVDRMDQSTRRLHRHHSDSGLYFHFSYQYAFGTEALSENAMD